MEDQRKKDLLKLNVGTQATGEIIWAILRKKKKGFENKLVCIKNVHRRQCKVS